MRADCVAAVVWVADNVTKLFLTGGGEVEVAGFVDDVMGAVKAGYADPMAPQVVQPSTYKSI